MARLFSNNAFGTLAANILSTATELTLVTSQGARFPSPTGGDDFLVTLIGESAGGTELAWEIVRVTARANDTLTIVRGQEGTTAAAWALGTRVELRLTGGSMSLFPQFTSTGHLPVGGTVANLIGSAGRALTLTAGTTGDSFASLELQGSRSADGGSFALISFWSKTDRVATITSRRGAADDSGDLGIFTKNPGGALTERVTVTNAGLVGVGATAPTAPLDVNGNTLRLRTSRTPASSTAAGNAGDICWDSNFIYVCVATNTWERAAIAPW